MSGTAACPTMASRRQPGQFGDRVTRDPRRDHDPPSLCADTRHLGGGGRRILGKDHAEHGQHEVGRPVERSVGPRPHRAVNWASSERAAASARATSSRRSAGSIPVTIAPRSAASRAAFPVPQPMSRTRSPARGAACSTTVAAAGSSCAATCSYSPRLQSTDREPTSLMRRADEFLYSAKERRNAVASARDV